MIQKNLADPPAISAEAESRLDFEQRNAADEQLNYNIFYIIENIEKETLVRKLYEIYHSSGDDELLAVNDLKSLLFNTALEMVKRGM